MRSLPYLLTVFAAASKPFVLEPEPDKNAPVPGVKACDNGYVLGSDDSTCLPYAVEYLANCTEDVQCDWLGENSACHFQQCTCNDGYHWYLGKCQKYAGLNEACDSSVQCYDGYNLESLTCTDQICSCSDGYYPRQDIDCRKIATGENAICALNIDCKDPDTECVIGKCKPTGTQSLWLEAEEEEEEQETSPKPTVDLMACTEDADCADLENSECNANTKTCICQKQFFFNEEQTECIAELGVNVSCTTDSDCQLRPGKCVDGVCFCRDYYVVDESKRNCIKTMSETNWNCLSNEWCYALGTESFCSRVTLNCSCSVTAEYDPDFNVCVGTGNGTVCNSDNECISIYGGLCWEQHCGCSPDYVLEDEDICSPQVIGGTCDEVQTCHLLPLSECVDGTCQCIDNYMNIDNSCYRTAPNVGDECERSEQCLATYATCDNSTCICPDSCLIYDDKCYKKKEFDSYCDIGLECTLSLGDSVQCRNRACQCPTGYSMEDNVCFSSSLLHNSSIVLSLVVFIKILLL